MSLQQTQKRRWKNLSSSAKFPFFSLASGEHKKQNAVFHRLEKSCRPKDPFCHILKTDAKRSLFMFVEMEVFLLLVLHVFKLGTGRFKLFMVYTGAIHLLLPPWLIEDWTAPKAANGPGPALSVQESRNTFATCWLFRLETHLDQKHSCFVSSGWNLCMSAASGVMLTWTLFCESVSSLPSLECNQILLMLPLSN